MPAPNFYAPPVAQPLRRSRNGVRCAVAVVLGWLTSVGTYLAIATVINRQLAHRAWHASDYQIVLLGTLVLMAFTSLLGALVSLRLHPRPWWGAPAIVATLLCAQNLITFASRGSFQPIMWAFMAACIAGSLGGAFLFSRRASMARSTG